MKKRHAAITIAGIAVAWIVWSIYGALSMVPVAATDYGRVIYERALEHRGVTPDGFTPSENGWDDLVAATTSVDGAIRAGGNLISAKWPDETLELGILRGGGTYRADRADELYIAAVHTVREIRESGADERLGRALSARVMARKQATGELVNMVLPELGPARSMARYIAADMALASLEGDTARSAAQFDHGLRLAAVFEHQWFLIETLVGIAIETLVMGEMGSELTERDFTVADLDAILDALARHPDIDARYVIDGERIMIRSFLQGIYTDDGRGNGRLILSRYAALVSSWGTSVGLGVPQRLGPIANVGSGLFASKKEAIARADAIYDAITEFASTPPHQRSGPPVVQGSGPLSLSSLKYSPLSMFMPSLSGPVRSVEMLRCHRAGLTTLVAIELYRARHGRLPDSIAELVPSVLKELPLDPYSGKPLVYRLATTGDPEAPRGFILYSVGPDLTDDGGLFRGESSWDGEWQHAGQIWNSEAPRDRAYHMRREAVEAEDEFANAVQWSPPDISIVERKENPGQPQ